MESFTILSCLNDGLFYLVLLGTLTLIYGSLKVDFLTVIFNYSYLALPKVTAFIGLYPFSTSAKSTIFGFWLSERVCALDKNCRVPFLRKGLGCLLPVSYDI